MKRFKIVLVLLAVSLFLSCDTDRDDIELSAAEANELNIMVQKGEWHISQFTLNNVESTSTYSSYNFVFGEANNLTASTLADEVNGTWRISNDSGDEFDSYNDVDFNIFFSSTGKLGELTRNYDVISATNKEIKLILEQSTNGDTARLTFSKN
jgi:hypothetical protein